MKRLILLVLAMTGLHCNAQITLFEDSFEFYDDFAISAVGDWTLTDVDLRPTYGFQGVTFPNSGVAKSFQVFNSTATVAPLEPSATSDWSARTGNKNMVCFAAVPNAAVTANNDWLISPLVTLGASGNTLKFWAKSCDADFGAERFRVAVSTTGTAPANFTNMLSPAPYITTLSDVTYMEYTYNLDAFAGQDIYFGFNCISSDQFGLAIDDVTITADVLAAKDFVSQNFNVYPNPAHDVLNVTAQSSHSIRKIQLTDLNGRTVREQQLTTAALQLNISDLKAGVYFLKITSDSGSGITKVVKN